MYGVSYLRQMMIKSGPGFFGWVYLHDFSLRAISLGLVCLKFIDWSVHRLTSLSMATWSTSQTLKWHSAMVISSSGRFTNSRKSAGLLPRLRYNKIYKCSRTVYLGLKIPFRALEVVLTKNTSMEKNYHAITKYFWQAHISSRNIFFLHFGNKNLVNLNWSVLLMHHLPPFKKTKKILYKHKWIGGCIKL